MKGKKHNQNKADDKTDICLAVGGQAVIEGVMMRSPNYYATSVRTDKGKIVSQVEKIETKNNLGKIVFIRGVVNLVDMLVIGVKTLTWSANQSSEDEEEQLSDKAITWTLITAFLFAIGLFVALPYILSILTGIVEEEQPVLFNLVDGIIKIIVLVVYLFVISQMKDIKRVFEYHGAEHKTVYCHEAGKELTIDNVKKYSRFHPRCGTSFLLVVMLISVFVFAIIPSLFSLIFPNFLSLGLVLRKIIMFLVRMLFLPIIAGISYELLRLSGKYRDNKLVKFAISPGLMLQHITTREPDNSQIEVAINSMKLVLEKENQ